MRFLFSITMLLLVSLFIQAGEPPFPEGLGYPNVIRPESQFGSLGSQVGLFNTPRGVSYNPKNNVYCIADTLNNRIQVVDIDGNISRKVNPLIFDLKLLHPHSVDCSREKDIIIGDTGNNRILIVNKKITEIKLKNKKIFISQVIPSRKGGFLVLDHQNDRLYRINKKGQATMTVGGQHSFSGLKISNPLGLDEDDKGRIYIADSDNSRILKLSKKGRYLDSWGTWGSYSGNLAGPAGISISGGRLFVADQINHRIQVFDLNGKYLFQWARHPSVKHGGNGRVHYPYAIKAYNSGREAIVCEPFEHRCQVFSVEKARDLVAVNDSAWWQKATKFHYGTKVSTQPSIAMFIESGFNESEIIPTNIFAITEPDTHATIVFDYATPLPKLIAILGGYGNEDENLIRPVGVAMLADGKMFISDAGNRKVNFYNFSRVNTMSEFGARIPVEEPTFILKTTIHLNSDFTQIDPSNGVRGIEPGAIDVGPDRSVYVLYPGMNTIVQIRETGEVGEHITMKDIVRPLDFEFANDLKSFYAVDHYGYEVVQYDLNGDVIRRFGGAGVKDGEFTLPFGIAISDVGTIFVSDVGQNRIKAFNSEGDFLFQWGHWGTEAGEFYKPKGLDIDREGRIVVTDFGNHRGQVFSITGEYIGEFGIGAGYKAVLRP